MATSDSRLPGFYRLPLAARRDQLSLCANLDSHDLATLDGGGLDLATADRIVENAVGIYALPLGLGLNFRINGDDYLVPMAVEEPSVIAAASNAARMVRAGGGFRAEADEPIMTAQVELVGVSDTAAGRRCIEADAAGILALANAAVPRLVGRGGGARALEVRCTEDVAGIGRRLVVHLHIDCCDAMGANLVNTVAEAIAPRLATLAGGQPGLRILTNLADRRLVRVTAPVPFSVLARPERAPGLDGKPADASAADTAPSDSPTFEDGRRVASDIAAASRFADDDPYRAATHNKGIMNGVDAVVIATGNDWRGVEAGAHAFAAASGRYRPLATWTVEGEALVGRLVMPMAVGTVGGTVQVHRGARLALRILGVSSARDLAMVIGCVGLAANLAALRALATEGIQRGHMALHDRANGTAGKAIAAAGAAP
jgi:hydroxymethylglutaryl-CoA reductase